MNAIQLTAAELLGNKMQVASPKEADKGSSFESMLESIQSKPKEETQKTAKAPSEKNKVEPKQDKNKNQKNTLENIPAEEKKPSVTMCLDMSGVVQESDFLPSDCELVALADSENMVQELPLVQDLESDTGFMPVAETPDEALLAAGVAAAGENAGSTNLSIESDSLSKKDAEAALLAEKTPDMLSEESALSLENEAVPASEALAQEKDSGSSDKSDGEKEKRETSRKEPVISVIDERTVVPAENRTELKDDKKSLALDGNSAEKSVAQNFSVVQQNVLSSNSQTAAGDGSVFMQMVSQQVQQNAPEFVKAAQIVLRDSDSGSINIIMKPENLGNVKISLQLSDKIIAGQITVTTKEAYEAFKQNIDVLKTAFQNSGFDDASLNLNLAQNSGNGFFGQGQEQSGGQYLSDRAYSDYASSPDSKSDTVSSAGAAAYNNGGDYIVDVVA